MKQVSATVISNIELMPGYHLICIDAPDIAATSRPGQFVTVRCGEELTLRRPFSIHQIAKSGQLYFFFKVIGKGTAWLSLCRKGEKLDILGPLGNGFHIKPTSKKLLLVAGGIGIAPLTFLAQQSLAQEKSVTLLLGAHAKDELYPQKLLPSEIETTITTEDGSYGEEGKVTDILSRYVNLADQIYACGPLAMYKEIAKQRQKWRGKKPIQVSLEVRMGCGIGACFSCSIKTKNGMKRVCRDGPVFNLDDVTLEEVKI
ncbi:MAG: dihydroorotate dehydrogenase electron transfer subunit [Dehalococcoidia bacterium]